MIYKVIKKIIEKFVFLIFFLFRKHTIRYSRHFNKAQNIFGFSPREEMLKTAKDFIAAAKLEGDYLEFGVFEGKIFISAYHFIKKLKLKNPIQFYAFDSFKGLPEVRGIDADENKSFHKAQYSADENRFKKNIRNKGVDLKRVSVISGFYNETLNQATKEKLPIKKASIVWIDCDLYESTVPVLNFITDYIQDGTILIFDDWFCFKGNPNKGEQKAFREWLKKNNQIYATQFHKFGWHGNSFIMHRD